MPTRCIIVIFWYTETNAERKENRWREDTSYEWHDCGRFPNYFLPPVNHPQPPSEEDQTTKHRFKYKIKLYISLILSGS